MRLLPIPTLLAVNVLLALGLAALWVDQHGQPRAQPWRPPAAIAPELPPPLAPVADADPGTAILARPLFAPDRLPPPPPVVVQAPPPDPFANTQLTGLLQGEFNTALALVEGRPRRLRLNDTIGEWQLVAIDGRQATFKRGGEERTLTLAYARLAAPGTPAATPAPSSARVQPAPTRGGIPNNVVRSRR